MATVSTTPFRFLNMPAELRILVYRQHFRDSQVYLTDTRESAVAHLDPLLLTTFSIYKEARLIHASLCTIHVGNIEHFRDYRKVTPDGYSSFIRHLVITDKDPKYIYFSLCRLPKLKLLEVKLNVPYLCSNSLDGQGNWIEGADEQDVIVGLVQNVWDDYPVEFGDQADVDITLDCEIITGCGCEIPFQKVLVRTYDWEMISYYKILQ